MKRNSLDPPIEEMRQQGYQLIDRIVEHMATLSDQRVAKRGTGAEFAAQVDEDLPEESRSIEECVDFYFGQVVPGMTRVNHPRFHAFIPCPSSYAGMVGSMLAAGTNPFVGSWLGGATVASLELTCLLYTSPSPRDLSTSRMPSSA